MDLRSWFESISIDDIRRFVEDDREEDLHLDFKLVNDPNLNNRDDRKNFAEAVAGFANADGGLIIWGVDCRKNADGVDCAITALGVDDLKKFHNRLIEFSGSAANPSVTGLDHRALSVPGNGDRGFVVTYVPASDAGPHMAKLGEDRYYKRSGASFLKMEHFEIADMFGRRPHPKLDLTYEVATPSRSGSNYIKHSVYLILKNCGRGSARSPYLALRLQYPFGVEDSGADGNYNQGLRYRYDQGTKKHHFQDVGGSFLHPDILTTVTCISAAIAANDAPPDLVIDYAVGAADLPPQTGTLVIPASELQPPG